MKTRYPLVIPLLLAGLLSGCAVSSVQPHFDSSPASVARQLHKRQVLHQRERARRRAHLLAHPHSFAN